MFIFSLVSNGWQNTELSLKNEVENLEAVENVITYNISKHASERYAERIMGKEDNLDINRFITLNEEKIKTDINKLIRYGELIYQGRQTQKEGKGNVIDVYLKDCWVVLADSRSKNVITLYKVDFGLDEEFNKIYVSKMMEKLNTYKEALERTKTQVGIETITYREMIADAEAQIKEYRTMIKNLEELCIGYKTIVDNNNVKVAQANKDVADVVNALIGKREF